MPAKIAYNEDLKLLIKDYRLRRQDVADLLDVNINTIDSWLTQEGSPRYRTFSWRNLMLLSRLLDEGRASSV